MRFNEPSENGFTVYSKSNCCNCDYVKELLCETTYKIVECDKYLEEDKEAFKNFMFVKMGFFPADNKLYFPVVFFKGRYLKSYKEVIDYI